jgi:anti-sigma regulatory factor (Ser/Thr protein kinase)
MMVDHFIFYTPQSRFSVYAHRVYVDEHFFDHPTIQDTNNPSFYFITQYDLGMSIPEIFPMTCFIAMTVDELLIWFEKGGVFGFLYDERVKENVQAYTHIMGTVYENQQKNLRIYQHFVFPFSCKIYLFEDCESLADFIQKLCLIYVNKDVKTGVHELLTNAMEHGHYPISLSLQIKNDLTNILAQRKKKFNENFGKYVSVTGEIKPYLGRAAIQIMIQDMGDGFDWKNRQPSSKTAYDGRGLMIAKAISFDALTYNEKGNCVTGYIYLN